jgi:hypothetical protein
VSYSVDNGDQSLTTSTNVKNVNFGAPYALGHKGRDPVAARIADVNADGWADIVVLNQGDSSVAVYVNRGNRTFDAPVVIPVGTGPVAMDVTDLDGDTCPDIVTSDSVGRTLTLLRNLVNCRDQ